MTYRFFIRLSNKKETIREETAASFKECLILAQSEAKFLNGKVIAWEEL